MIKLFSFDHLQIIQNELHARNILDNQSWHATEELSILCSIIGRVQARLLTVNRKFSLISLLDWHFSWKILLFLSIHIKYA